MRYRASILFLVDTILFFSIYLLFSLLFKRPFVLATSIILYFIFILSFWYFRLYNLELFFNRLQYISRGVQANIISFLLFGGVWLLFLKTQWNYSSRLIILTVFIVFGIIYFFSLRMLLGSFLLKTIKIYYFLSSKHKRLFKSKLQKFTKNPMELKNLDDFDKKVKKGFLLISYFPSENIKTRADMWEEYFNQIIKIKERISGKKITAFIFNIYNKELDSGLSTFYLYNIPSLKISPKINTFYKNTAKRVLDIILTVSLLPLFYISYPFIYLIIRMNLGLPVIFKQIRIGKNMTKFELLKYRTMRIIAGAKEGDIDEIHLNYIKTLLAEEKDTEYSEHEIIQVEKKIRKLKNRGEFDMLGLILRKSSIDELPQLINVLKNQMSIVGPRPALPYETEIYPDWVLNRFISPQGITGLWQIAGRGTMPLHTSLFLDCYYALEYSFYKDFFIIMKTIKSILNFSNVF